jgi:hypothetical protein
VKIVLYNRKCRLKINNQKLSFLNRPGEKFYRYNFRARLQNTKMATAMFAETLGNLQHFTQFIP